MQSMSRAGRAYVLSILLASVPLIGGALLQLDPGAISWPTFVILTVAASIAQFFEAKAGRASYYPSYVFLFAGIVLLPSALFVGQVTLVLLAEVIRDRVLQHEERRLWYIQAFNIATHIIAGILAQSVLQGIRFQIGPLPLLAPIVQALAAALLYIVLINLIIGHVLVLARGISWSESGVFTPQNLLTEWLLVCLGYVMAALWTTNPYMCLPALAPLVLMHRSLQIPQLQQEARSDAKTGLFNARYFDRRLNEAIEHSQRSGRSLALLMADLDFMRHINNTYGHLAGDMVLRAIAQIIRDTVRKHDSAGRFGGEEFAIVLPEVSPMVAYAIAERLRQAVADTDITIGGGRPPIRVTMSIGVAYFPDDATTATTLLRAADVAVYESKRQGRNRVTCVWDLPAEVKARYFVESQTDAPATEPAADTSAPTAAPEAQAPLHVEQRPAQPLPPPAQGPAPAMPGPGPTRASACVRWYVRTVCAAGLVSLALGLDPPSGSAWLAIGLFAVLAVLAELLPVTVYADHTISVSVSIIFAAALTTGVPGLAIVSGAIALTHHVRLRRSRHDSYKTLFNWATHVLAGLAPLSAATLLATHHTSAQLIAMTVYLALLSLAYFVIESSLIAGAISLSTRSAFRATWHTQFGWLVPHYIVLGLMGAILAAAAIVYGPIGVGLFMFPVLMMRVALRQYVDNTKRSVADLQRMNRELAASSVRIQHINEELFVTLGRVLDARDPYTSFHSATVARYATSLAREMGLSAEQIENVRRAGILHDIGKIAISDTVLYKNTKLTHEEYEGIKLHSQIGSSLLEASSALRHLAPFVRAHHERWDGQGYPNGLQQESIPIEGRILAVCDTVEAMASDRPYQASQPWPTIRAELERCAGSQFDPVVVAAFLQIVEREGAAFVSRTAPGSRGETREAPGAAHPPAATRRHGDSSGMDFSQSVQTA